jgi:hypothetical protein
MYMANMTSFKRRKSDSASGTRPLSFDAGIKTGDGKSSVVSTSSCGSLLAALAALAAWGGTVRADTIAIPNGSFESPSTTFVNPQVDSWQKTPKPFWYDESGGNLWEQLSGVFMNTAPGTSDHIGNCEGNQAIFLFSLPEVGIFQDYNSTDSSSATPAHAFNAKYEAGNSYRLTFGLIGGGGGMTNGATIQASLYYRDRSSNQVTVASTTITNTLENFPNTTNFVEYRVNAPAVRPGDAWAGQNIGVQILSTVRPDLAGGYWDLDNVRLSSVLETPLALVYETIGSSLKISWPSVAGRQYQAQTSENLVNWASYETPQTCTGGVISKLVPTNDRTKAFFRVQAGP